MMERKISPQTERKLTHAIEKAASLALVQPDQNRSKMLADVLLGDGIENAFAKTAAAMFNRRVTVLRFQKTVDEHKAETFPLADADAVLSYMGGAADMPKAASEQVVVQNGPFCMTVTKYADGSIEKTASVVTPPLFETTMDYPHFEHLLECTMDKQMKAHSEGLRELHKLGGLVEQERHDIAEKLKKVGSFEFRTLCNLYGEGMEFALGDLLPADTDFSKTASVVDPHTELSDSIGSMLEHMRQYINMNNDLADHQASLEEFGKTAADVANGMRKSAMGPGAFAAMAIRNAVGAAGAGINAAEAVRRAGNDALSEAFNQAMAYNRAGTDIDVRPAKILDSEFLIRDRFRDRMLAWSDLSADPMLSKYDPKELFVVAQRAMDTMPSMERPDHREELRAYVSQMMPQNGRQSIADIAALSTIARARGTAKETAQADALAPVSLMDKEKAPEAPNTDKSVLDVVKNLELGKGSEKWLSEAVAELRTSAKERQEKQDAKDKALAAADKKRTDLLEAAEKQRQAEIKNLAAFMKTMGIKPHRTSAGVWDGYYLTKGNGGLGKSMSRDEILQMYEGWKAATPFGTV